MLDLWCNPNFMLLATKSSVMFLDGVLQGWALVWTWQRRWRWWYPTLLVQLRLVPPFQQAVDFWQQVIDIAWNKQSRVTAITYFNMT